MPRWKCKRICLEEPGREWNAAPIAACPADPVPALAEPTLEELEAMKCPKGTAAHEQEGWEWIKNNAARTADAHAIENNPMASFALSKVEVNFQYGGEHAGEYLVMLLDTSGPGTSFAVLKPNFDFCTDPSTLDDEREDLFTVLSAKHDGIHY